VRTIAVYMERMIRTLLALLVLATAASAAGAQGQASSYPNVDRVVTIAAGDSVRLLIRVVNDGAFARPPGRRLDFIYSSSIPAGSAERKAQADRAAEYFGPQAVEIGARRLSIGICDTQACAQRKDPPSEWYLYERTSRGWKRLPD
jgi:hypothetical protein